MVINFTHKDALGREFIGRIVWLNGYYYEDEEGNTLYAHPSILIDTRTGTYIINRCLFNGSKKKYQPHNIFKKLRRKLHIINTF